MTTLIASPRALDDYDPDATLSEEGEAAIARALEEHMAQCFGGTWEAVPGGEADGEWSRLSAGNGFGLPTPEQVEEAQRYSEYLLEDPGYWRPRARYLTLDTSDEPGSLSIASGESGTEIDYLGEIDYVTDAGAPAKETLAAALEVAAKAGWVRVAGAAWDADIDPFAYVVAVRRA